MEELLFLDKKKDDRKKVKKRTAYIMCQGRVEIL